jgi:hypothetical protein
MGLFFTKMKFTNSLEIAKDEPVFYQSERAVTSICCKIKAGLAA